MCRFRSPYNLHIHTHQKTFNFPSNLFIRNHTQIIYWLDWRIWSVIARNEQNRFLVVLSSQRFFFFFYLFFSLFFLNLTKIVKKCFSSVSAVFCFCHSGYEKPHLTLSKLHAHIVWSLSYLFFLSFSFAIPSDVSVKNRRLRYRFSFLSFFFSDTFYRISQKVNLAIVWLTRF